ncbi:MAG: hypothetical protein HQM12_07430 [SAR324 cluster bacterium]|nr:hypothetical protein [SAR324 cluster bacterium]
MSHKKLFLNYWVRRKNWILGFNPAIDPLHGWRKSGITPLLIIGVPVSLVQAMAGHANPQTTLKH